MATDTAPASSAEASQTDELDSTPSTPTLAPTHENYMAHDISEADDVRAFDQPDADLPPLPTEEDDSIIHHVIEEEDAHNDESVFEDREMKRQLMDIESSFIPEAPIQVEAPQGQSGVDDTYLFGGSPGNSQQSARPLRDDADMQRVMNNLEELLKPKKKPKKLEVRSGNTPTKSQSRNTLHSNSSSFSEAPTPADAYKTPAARRLDFGADDSMDTSTATSEVGPSSPAAEAAQRSQSRASASQTTEQSEGEEEDSSRREEQAAPGAQQKEVDVRRPTSSASTVKAPDFSLVEEGSSLTNENESSVDSIAMPPPPVPATAQKISKRPSYLQHRHSSQRSSVSSFTNRSDASGDGGSTASLGADYALQTGGAIPRSSGPRGMSLGLSRLPSLGSIASSMSGYSDTNPWEKGRSISTNSLSAFLQPDNSLGRLDEEVPNSATPPETPRAPSVQPAAPTDTVIARHVQDIQVPDSIARDFRAKHSRSPDKRHMATPFTRSKHNLTLKEQNSKIDKLSKENFDLKLKIHFLDQALQNRSDEGVKEMISKNVQLQTDLATEKKESQSMRKKIRDLERRLKAQEEGNASSRDLGSGSEDGRSVQSSRQAELEEEIEFLRERLESTEITVDQWQQEALQKEADNRRMADYIKTMREKSSGEDSAGFDEAINMWKEDFEEERARREQVESRCQQAETESERLREEVERLQEQNQQMQHSTTNHHFNKTLNNSRRIQQSFAARSNSGSDGNENTAPISLGGTSSTLVEHLQSDNEKLQRDLHAQASMLTSRNRENLRLREENEGLKLTIRRGDAGSTAGDSILERSISRNHMRSVSRASGGTRLTQQSDPDREDFESKHAALRDELSQLKLSYKELDDQLNGHLDMLETTENKVKELEREIEAQTEDLQALASERDEALELLQDKEQECEELRQEALDTVQRLEIDLEQKQAERDRLYNDLENTTEDFHALQQEMKNVSESLLQLEDDRDASLRKIQNLEAELGDANEELNRQDKLLSEERSKNERLDVQLESCQGEIDFLREEQEGDKIKIGELESALNHTQVTLQEARERSRDLEERMAEERQQRDVLETQEKQEVEKIITDLNGQLTKLKEDSRKLRKNLSSKEVEASTWKQRHDELEHTLRESLGNLNGTRSSLFKDIAKLQRDLQATMQELEVVKADLAEKDRLLRARDTLLESAGLESRRLSEMLERERQARRQDQTTFENAKRGHQSTARAIQQHESRVLELETLRSQDRQKLHSLEKQYKEQLLERNNLLYALWNRLSTLCGAEWSRNNALINGELTSMELISRNVQGFNKNIILAVRTVESVIGAFKQRIRNIENNLVRDYQTLEHSLDARSKRLDQLEKLVMAQRQSIGRPSTVRGGIVDLNTAELNKLRTENKTLRSEVQTLRAITTTTQSGNDVIVSRSPSRAASPVSSKRASMAQTLLRAHSASVVENYSTSSTPAPGHPYPAAGPLQPSEQKWIHRLKELERRLKAEREARLLDRSGARKRLEQKVEENADLRAALEKERDRRDEDDAETIQRSASAGGSRIGGSGRASVVGSVRHTNGSGKERGEDIY
ncbi:Anucleate primary sterigmata protein B [Alternaria tenuissima]|uniref:Anucleate primary sterigmata protein B n=1 Tax=Alternaria tenuissima TaxID=119927 RepID=A0ABY0GIP6_9PLEO|nr:Anucleate primary sterigmata protein B [Alternaria tenuissima]RYO04291.1 Anucleate primary sterigmata protein B [Alternaria tenuissima]RYO25880.1 Anucleate primary sterigmata protein B [Alternaria tenuissima]